MSDNAPCGTADFPLPTPGVEHSRLKPFVGRFRAVVKLWMGPGDPMVTTGIMENTLQLNGLYLHQDYVGDQQDGPFQSFQGKGYWGYNFTAKEYEGFWIDTASSIMQTEHGTVDGSGKVWTMRSEVAMPPDGKLTKKRTVIRVIDNDHHTMESFMEGPDGKEMKTMEIDYRRAP